ncbi:hypothetical protein RFI_07657 [Reticulomyxa filosa]|uniref:Uncharacterized protein n=1 Tax=Reticulomyxa filosa TaxID=46433 RepID=X6NW18_RETFI|nr:hypothetical protein RFI_07657 [Reticulomyxa filosa]|eukprot:ETO29462.1 hypothetical protein RFI_07657 [Reticulomyxa filosa]
MEAKELYEKVLELKQDHAIAHFNLANLLRKDLKDYKSAETYVIITYAYIHFLKSIKQKPKFTAALNNYATMLHHQLKRYKDAEYYYLQAICVDPQYSRAHFNYANLCREHLVKFETAQEHYLIALETDENNPNFHNNYGLLLQYSLKNYREAKTQYEEALRLDPAHALGHCNYATILMQMVDKKYNPNMDDLSDPDEDSQPRKISAKKRELYLQKSEKHFKQSIQLNSQLVMAYNNYGCLLRRLERYDDAIKMFEKALTIDPKFVMAKRNLRKTHELNGTIPPKSTSTANENVSPPANPNSNSTSKITRNVNESERNVEKNENCSVM